MSKEHPKGWQPGLASELKRLSEAVRRVSDQVSPNEMPAAMVPVPGAGSHYLAKADTIYRQRRRRAECFPIAVDLFQDPAWDILLHLFIAHERGLEESIGSAAIASGVHPRVGQRWVKALESADMVETRPHPNSPNLAFVRVTQSAVEMMRCFLDGMSAGR